MAQLRDPQLPPNALLNILGVAPRWFTVFTLGTTIAALISLLTGPWSWPWVAVMFRLAMNAFWWLQLVALLGIAALAMWGIWGRFRR